MPKKFNIFCRGVQSIFFHLKNCRSFLGTLTCETLQSPFFCTSRLRLIFFVEGDRFRSDLFKLNEGETNGKASLPQYSIIEVLSQWAPITSNEQSFRRTSNDECLDMLLGGSVIGDLSPPPTGAELTMTPAAPPNKVPLLIVGICKLKARFRFGGVGPFILLLL
uniref:Uncharacterized protein n=1 Tax=Romanomermis culicivorax TaxID=13658 RepID=A0A915JJC4_ROMCU